MPGGDGVLLVALAFAGDDAAGQADAGCDSAGHEPGLAVVGDDVADEK